MKRHERQSLLNDLWDAKCHLTDHAHQVGLTHYRPSSPVESASALALVITAIVQVEAVVPEGEPQQPEEHIHGDKTKLTVVAGRKKRVTKEDRR
jgi:hypothetical protein